MFIEFVLKKQFQIQDVTNFEENYTYILFPFQQSLILNSRTNHEQ